MGKLRWPRFSGGKDSKETSLHFPGALSTSGRGFPAIRVDIPEILPPRAPSPCRSPCLTQVCIKEDIQDQMCLWTAT